MMTVTAECLKTETYFVQISVAEDSQSALPFCHPDTLRQSEGPFA